MITNSNSKSEIQKEASIELSARWDSNSSFLTTEAEGLVATGCLMRSKPPSAKS